MELKVIGHVHTDFPEKFGIPRQSGLVDNYGYITFERPYVDPNAVRGLENYSHIWVIWGFSGNALPAGDAETASSNVAESAGTTGSGVTENAGAARAGGTESIAGTPIGNETNVNNSETVRPTGVRNWSPTVRPPRLGGNKRIGVFATRSPNRPNPIGLSLVELEKVHICGQEKGLDETELRGGCFEKLYEGYTGPVLVIKGADMLDGTPVYDIKPYLPYTEAVPEAVGGFADDVKGQRLKVEGLAEAYRKAVEYTEKETAGCSVPEAAEGTAPEIAKNTASETAEIMETEAAGSTAPEAAKDLSKDLAIIEELLAEDPRPHYQKDPERVYGMRYGNYEVRFRVEDDTVTVISIE